jgi:hypothetical protein
VGGGGGEKVLETLREGWSCWGRLHQSSFHAAAKLISNISGALLTQGRLSSNHQAADQLWNAHSVINLDKYRNGGVQVTFIK